MKTLQEINADLEQRVNSTKVAEATVQAKIKELKLLHENIIKLMAEIEAMQANIDQRLMGVELAYIPMIGRKSSESQINAYILNTDFPFDSELLKRKKMLLKIQEVEEKVQYEIVEQKALADFMHNVQVPGRVDLQSLIDYREQRKNKIIAGLKFSALAIALIVLLYVSPTLGGIVFGVLAIGFLSYIAYQRIRSGTFVALNTVGRGVVGIAQWVRGVMPFMQVSSEFRVSNTMMRFMQNNKLPILHNLPILPAASNERQQHMIAYLRQEKPYKTMSLHPAVTAKSNGEGSLHREMWRRCDVMDMLEFVANVESILQQVNADPMIANEQQLLQIMTNYHSQLQALVGRLGGGNDFSTKAEILALNLALAQQINAQPERRGLALIQYERIVVELDMLCGIDTKKMEMFTQIRTQWYTALDNLRASLSVSQLAEIKEELEVLDEVYKKSRYEFSLYDTVGNINYRLRAHLSYLLAESEVVSIANGSFAKKVMAKAQGLQSPLPAWQQRYVDLPAGDSLTPVRLLQAVSQVVVSCHVWYKKNELANLQQALQKIVNDQDKKVASEQLVSMLALLAAYTKVNGNKTVTLMFLPMICKYRHLLHREFLPSSNISFGRIINNYLNTGSLPSMFHTLLFEPRMREVLKKGHPIQQLTVITAAEKRQQFFMLLPALTEMHGAIAVFSNPRQRLAYHILHASTSILSYLRKLIDSDMQSSMLSQWWNGSDVNATHIEVSKQDVMQKDKCQNDYDLLESEFKELMECYNQGNVKKLLDHANGFLQYIDSLTLDGDSDLTKLRESVSLFVVSLKKSSADIDKEVFRSIFFIFYSEAACHISMLNKSDASIQVGNEFPPCLLLLARMFDKKSNELPSCYRRIAVIVDILMHPTKISKNECKRMIANALVEWEAIISVPKASGLMLPVESVSAIVSDAKQYAQGLAQCAHFEKKLYFLEKTLRKALNGKLFSELEGEGMKYLLENIHLIQDKMQNFMGQVNKYENTEVVMKELQEEIKVLQLKIDYFAMIIAPQKQAIQVAGMMAKVSDACSAFFPKETLKGSQSSSVFLGGEEENQASSSRIIRT